jgi:hypothetical protein
MCISVDNLALLFTKCEAIVYTICKVMVIAIVCVLLVCCISVVLVDDVAAAISLSLCCGIHLHQCVVNVNTTFETAREQSKLSSPFHFKALESHLQSTVISSQ